ncbi:hypothetical protein [Nitratidesulfovibrio vulgaris]|uniref:hypothetical protein n=1 Tax=Nitratidesulfovibrio vulgaris TaxID=881 RepID=UPI00167F74DE|nr:hypothetical protein [Nitratidesulfovibrio vulgaris]
MWTFTASVAGREVPRAASVRAVIMPDVGLPVILGFPASLLPYASSGDFTVALAIRRLHSVNRHDGPVSVPRPR